MASENDPLNVCGQESGDKTSYSTSSLKNGTDPIHYELTFVHINGDPVFWLGGFGLSPQVTFRGDNLNLSIGNIIGRYLGSDYFESKFYSRDKLTNGEILLIKGNFKPVSNHDTFSTLFEHEGETKCTIYIRRKDLSFRLNNTNRLNLKDQCCADGARETDINNNTIQIEDKDRVLLEVKEVSGRRILWDQHQVFDSTIQLQFPRSQLPNLRVDAVLSRFVASSYFENEENIMGMQIWTDKVKVVGLKDTLDVLCLSSWKIKLFLKHIRNADDLQWQQILDAVNEFEKKVESTDDELRSYYERSGVFDDMKELKLKIQMDHRNEEDIHNMMMRLEPKLNQALSYISTKEEPATGTGSSSNTNLKQAENKSNSSNNRHSDTKCNVSRSRAPLRSTAIFQRLAKPQPNYKFYCW